ncbi:MAG: hypothetical protein NVS9B8_08560 [Candidatus Limnocylindrales bacterium]
MRLDGPEGHQMAHYDLDDPEDFVHAVKTGVVWNLGSQGMAQKAFDMIQQGKIPLAECHNVPSNIYKALKGSKS